MSDIIYTGNVKPQKAINIGNLDFYLCPKCGTNTIRYAQYVYNGGTETISDHRDDSYSLVSLNRDNVEYIDERATAIKIAVKRDPVERFISALRWHNHKHDLNLSVEDVLSDNTVPEQSPHFIPQSYFYGNNPEKYDHIIYMHEVTNMILTLTGKDVGTIHKGQQLAAAITITSQQQKLIKNHYAVDYENGYC